MTRNITVNATVSIRAKGELYVGAEARNILDVEKNDRVRVTIPRIAAPDISVSGHLNDSNHIQIGVEKAMKIAGGEEEFTGQTERVDAIVEEAARSWDEENPGPKSRFTGYYTLPAGL